MGMLVVDEEWEREVSGGGGIPVLRDVYRLESIKLKNLYIDHHKMIMIFFPNMLLWGSGSQCLVQVALMFINHVNSN